MKGSLVGLFLILGRRSGGWVSLVILTLWWRHADTGLGKPQ